MHLFPFQQTKQGFTLLFTTFCLMPTMAMAQFKEANYETALTNNLSDYIVVDYYGARCPPCTRQHEIENPKLRKAGIRVLEVFADKDGDHIADAPHQSKEIKGFPTLRIQKYNARTGKYHWVMRGNYTGNQVDQTSKYLQWNRCTPAGTIQREVQSRASVSPGDLPNCCKVGVEESSSTETPQGSVSDTVRWESVQVPYQSLERTMVAGTGWARGRTSCGNSGCSMCYPQYRMQAVTRYRTEKRAVPVVTQAPPSPEVAPAEDAVPLPPEDPGQAPTPPETRTRMLALLRLSPESIHADLGGGNGDVSIEAVSTYGCHSLCVEIDPRKCAEARENVTQAGLDGYVTVLCMDVKDFNPEKYGVTAATAYLYPELLEEISPLLSSIPQVVTPFHEVPDLHQEKIGDCYLYQKQVSFSLF